MVSLMSGPCAYETKFRLFRFIRHTYDQNIMVFFLCFQYFTDYKLGNNTGVDAGTVQRLLPQLPWFHRADPQRDSERAQSLLSVWRVRSRLYRLLNVLFTRTDKFAIFVSGTFDIFSRASAKAERDLPSLSCVLLCVELGIRLPNPSHTLWNFLISSPDLGSPTQFNLE